MAELSSFSSSDPNKFLLLFPPELSRKFGFLLTSFILGLGTGGMSRELESSSPLSWLSKKPGSILDGAPPEVEAVAGFDSGG